MEYAKADGSSGDTTPGTRNANPMKWKLCRMRSGRSASTRRRKRSFGQREDQTKFGYFCLFPDDSQLAAVKHLARSVLS